MFSRIPGMIRIWFGRLVTYLFYCASLVFFFAPDLGSVFTYFSKLWNIQGPIVIDDLSTKPFALIIYIPLFLFLELIQEDFSVTFDRINNFWLGDKMKQRMFRWFVYSTIITILFVVGFKAQQFVYANF